MTINRTLAEQLARSEDTIAECVGRMADPNYQDKAAEMHRPVNH